MMALYSVSCTSNQKKSSGESDREVLTMIGDSLAMLAQKTLLQNVTGAMQAGGPVHAVEFCNLKAGVLTDSIGSAAGITIQRVTDKPRNPSNGLSGGEIDLFRQIQDSLQNGTIQPHYLLDDKDGRTVFYKPIVLGMPACLQCHGTPGQDIEPATLLKITEKYPDDVATGYSLGQLRGMWKITLAQSK